MSILGFFYLLIELSLFVPWTRSIFEEREAVGKTARSGLLLAAFGAIWWIAALAAFSQCDPARTIAHGLYGGDINACFHSGRYSDGERIVVSPGAIAFATGIASILLSVARAVFRSDESI